MARHPLVNGLTRILRDVATRAVDRAVQSNRRTTRRPDRTGAAADQPGSTHRPRERATHQAAGYPGDYERRPDIVYNPHKDGEPDPGEIVWTWVPYEEDHSQGKDRPVLLIGRDGDWLLGLQVTSQDKDDHREREARAGRYWIDIGTGAWDHERRDSEVRVNRIIRIDPDAVRRIGAILDEQRFNAVASEVERHY